MAVCRGFQVCKNTHSPVTVATSASRMKGPEHRLLQTTLGAEELQMVVRILSFQIARVPLVQKP